MTASRWREAGVAGGASPPPHAGPCRRRRTRPAWHVTVALAAVSGLSWRARAADALEGTARAQLDAQALIAQGRYKEACEPLEASQRAAADPLIRWGVPACWEKAGRAARAWELYRQLAALPRASAEERRLATARAAALEPRLARLEIHVSEPMAAGLSVSIDGEPLPSRRWGGALRVDVGRHRIDARAPEHRHWEQIVQVSSAGAAMRIDVPPLVVGSDEEASGHPPPATSVMPTEGSNQPAPPPRPDYTAAYIAGGIGVAGLTFGAIAWRIASSKSADARKLCAQQSEGCPPALKDDRDALRRYAHAANRASQVGIGVGAVGLIAGSVLYFITRGRETDPADPVQVAPSIGMDRLGVSVSGSF